MKVLFLTLINFKSFNESNIYCDLLREFMSQGHDVYCISPSERRYNIGTHFEEDGHLLKLRIGNTQKSSIIEKGISTLMIGRQFKKAIKEYYTDIHFDLILYSTPPITLLAPIKYVKKRDHAKTYLMLKDIFPQNAVDLGMMQKRGLKSLIYWNFRLMEKRLYDISDKIGCMSPANAYYLVRNNANINSAKIEICPNAISVKPQEITKEEKIALRKEYDLPIDKKILIYGGNLGKPQDIV